MAKDTEIVGWPVSVWGAALHVCNATVYNWLAAGKIRARKVGGATRIETPPAEFLASQPEYEPHARPGPNQTGRNSRPSTRGDDQPSPAVAAWTAPHSRDDDRPEPPPMAAE